MTQFNIFLENTYSDFVIDDKKVYDNIVKITKFIFSDKDITSTYCLKDINYKTICFDIVLVNNEEIHRINKEYRNKDMPTDVITFAIFADSPEEEQFIFDGEINLGEIIISLDKIKEQAEDNNVTFEEELYFLSSHGILHLLGFDHQTTDDYNFMIEKQNKSKEIVL